MSLDTVMLGLDTCSGDMGTDFDLQKSTQAWVDAAVPLLMELPDLRVALYGDREPIKNALQKHSSPELNERLGVIHSKYHFDMEGKVQPSHKRRDRHKTTYWKALDDLSHNLISGIVSATSTDTLIVYANSVLGAHEYRAHVKCSPPIPVNLPNRHGGNDVLLDCGANKNTKESFMSMFAVMGVTYSQVFHNKKYPTVGLLSIGTEEKKSTGFLSKVDKDLRRHFEDQYSGYIEPNGLGGLFDGYTDVMVVDGLTGNFILKSIEAMSAFAREALKDEIINPQGNEITRPFKKTRNMIGGYLLQDAFNSLNNRFASEQYNGAPILGAKGQIFKAHGSSDTNGLRNAIRNAYTSIKSKAHDKFDYRLRENLQHYF